MFLLVFKKWVYKDDYDDDERLFVFLIEFSSTYIKSLAGLVRFIITQFIDKMAGVLSRCNLHVLYNIAASIINYAKCQSVAIEAKREKK